MYHTTTEGQMNLLLCAEAPTGIWSVLAGQNNYFSSDAKPFPDAPNFPVFTPYSPSTDFTLASLSMKWRPPTTYHYSLGLQSKLPAAPFWTWRTPEHATCTESLEGRSTRRVWPLPEPDSRPDYKYRREHRASANPISGGHRTSMYYFATDGEAWYSSLQVSLSQKFRHSFQYQAAYTWERLLSPYGLYHWVKRIRTIRRSDRAARSRRWIRTRLQCPATEVCTIRVLCSPHSNKSHPVLANTLGGWSVATATVVQAGQQGSITYNNINSVYGISGDRASYASGCNARMYRRRDRSVIEWTTTSTKLALRPRQ